VWWGGGGGFVVRVRDSMARFLTGRGWSRTALRSLAGSITLDGVLFKPATIPLDLHLFTRVFVEPPRQIDAALFNEPT